MDDRVITVDQDAQQTSLTWLTTPEMIDPRTSEDLAMCWRAVADAGGAVGFPFPPVDEDQVRSASATMIESLHPQRSRLLVASTSNTVSGWLLLRVNNNSLTQHWGEISRVQTSPQDRGTGIGRLLMGEAARCARDDLGLTQLHLAARGGLGLEEYYGRLGWREVGRWPDALRFSGTDHRDEVLMLLTLH
ncbi:GNAT family N-acetyltransferase [Geodermatophilus sp. DSM 44513]|uniref:GNAT family N-acetyltransferase n=1 Tax=Geodermatophilus sp. DSM 44513 TaxID=1528104 RepID=UPI001AA188DE|nr:GNAT family N-acetyltransferase [Geodermatophilus sp. DSM 44513]WNV74312.1 GNAT family N-acetyltransferase [Geodermatophilus sp. DSM 44513]